MSIRKTFTANEKALRFSIFFFFLSIFVDHKFVRPNFMSASPFRFVLFHLFSFSSFLRILTGSRRSVHVFISHFNVVNDHCIFVSFRLRGHGPTNMSMYPILHAEILLLHLISYKWWDKCVDYWNIQRKYFRSHFFGASTYIHIFAFCSFLHRSVCIPCLHVPHSVARFSTYIFMRDNLFRITFVVLPSNQFSYHVPKCIKIKYVQAFKNTFSHDSIGRRAVSFAFFLWVFRLCLIFISVFARTCLGSRRHRRTEWAMK